MQSIALLDRENPGSILNCLPTVISGQVEEIIRSNPHLFDMAEDELQKYIFKELSPTPAYNMLRSKFWTEYERHYMDRGSFKMERVFSGVCSMSTFYKMLKNPASVAWILCKPSDYVEIADEALMFSLKELRKILALPIMNAKGVINKSVLENKIKIFALLDARKHGAFMQRLEQKTLNISADAKDVKEALENMSSEDIDARIKQLERKSEKARLPDILAEATESVAGGE